MPRKLEKKLEKQAAKEGLKGDKKDAYVFGALRKAGWKPRREREGGK